MSDGLVEYMICLIDDVTEAKIGLSERLRRFISGREMVRLTTTTVFGLPVLRLTVQLVPRMTSFDHQKRINAIIKCLREEQADAGCRLGRVVFSREFPYREHVLREGFEEADSALISQLLAGELTEYTCPDGKTAVIIADALSTVVARVLIKLSTRYRRILTVIPSGGGRLYNELARRYGVSVISAPTPAQLQSADIALVFSEPSAKLILSNDCIVLPVGKVTLKNVGCRLAVMGCTFSIAEARADALLAQSSIDEEIMNCFPMDVLIAYALDCGVITAADIGIESVRVMQVPSVYD